MVKLYEPRLCEGDINMVEMGNGDWVSYEEYNRLEMQLLRVQARLMRVYAELDKLKDVDSCEHAFELYPNGVIQCIKCGFSHA